MKKFIPPKETYFAEIFQSHVIKFAFVTETPTTYEAQHGLVNCRDFLADVLHAEDMGKVFKIYNFSWDPERTKVDRDATKLVMVFNTSEQLTELKKNLHMLHAYEKSWKLRKTRIITISKTKAIIIGSRFYLKKGFAISLYTFLLKAFSISDSLETLTGNEKEYYESCGTNFNKLLTNLRKVLALNTNVAGVDIYHDSSITHNYAGFVAVCKHPIYQKHAKYLETL
jgi:hypothetical protein